MNYALFRDLRPRLRACASLALAFGAAFVMPAILATAAGPATGVGDETPHTVTSNDKSFASKGLDTDDKFEHVFSKEGDFGYICTVHPFMTGVVHVHKQ